MQEELLQLWEDTQFTVLFVTHSIPEAIRIGNRILLLSPHPGQAKAEINCAGLDRADQVGELLSARIERICSHREGEHCRWLTQASIGPTSFTSSAFDAEPGERRNRLSTWTKLYANGALRKTALLVLLALVWEIYARILDNPLLFPTFTATVAALWSVALVGRDSKRGRVHAVAVAERLRWPGSRLPPCSPPSRACRASARICSRR